MSTIVTYILTWMIMPAVAAVGLFWQGMAAIFPSIAPACGIGLNGFLSNTGTIIYNGTSFWWPIVQYLPWETVWILFGVWIIYGIAKFFFIWGIKILYILAVMFGKAL